MHLKVCAIFLTKTEAEKATGSVSLWLLVPNTLQYALFLLLWTYNTNLKQLKSLTSTLYSICLHLIHLLECFLSKIAAFPAIYSSESMEKGIQKSHLPLTTLKIKKKNIWGCVWVIGLVCWSLLFWFLHFRDLLLYSSLQSCERLSYN